MSDLNITNFENMVFCCFACGIHYNPLNTHRTFHRFPKNEDLKLKWLEAVGKAKVYNNAVICSDHFDEDDFSENKYATRRRLRPNVVPHTKHESILVIVEADESNSATDIPIEENYTSHNVDMCISNMPAKCTSGVITETNSSHTTESNLDVSDSVVDEAANSAVRIKLCDCIYGTKLATKKEPNFVPISQEDDDSSDTQQSELNVSDKSASTANTDANQYKETGKCRKVFVKLPNNTTDYFTRKDFTSDKAWSRFLKTMTYARHNRKLLQRATLRQKRRVKDMKNLLIYMRKDREKRTL